MSYFFSYCSNKLQLSEFFISVKCVSIYWILIHEYKIQENEAGKVPKVFEFCFAYYGRIGFLYSCFSLEFLVCYLWVSAVIIFVDSEILQTTGTVNSKSDLRGLLERGLLVWEPSKLTGSLNLPRHVAIAGRYSREQSRCRAPRSFSVTPQFL